MANSSPGRWLAVLKLSKYKGVLGQHGFTLQKLATCTDAELACVGLPIGPRRKILAHAGLMLSDARAVAAASVAQAPPHLVDDVLQPVTASDCNRGLAAPGPAALKDAAPDAQPIKSMQPTKPAQPTTSTQPVKPPVPRLPAAATPGGDWGHAGHAAGASASDERRGQGQPGFSGRTGGAADRTLLQQLYPRRGNPSCAGNIAAVHGGRQPGGLSSGVKRSRSAEPSLWRAAACPFAPPAPALDLRALRRAPGVASNSGRAGLQDHGSRQTSAGRSSRGTRLHQEQLPASAQEQRSRSDPAPPASSTAACGTDAAVQELPILLDPRNYEFSDQCSFPIAARGGAAAHAVDMRQGAAAARHGSGHGHGPALQAQLLQLGSAGVSLDCAYGADACGSEAADNELPLQPRPHRDSLAQKQLRLRSLREELAAQQRVVADLQRLVEEAEAAVLAHWG